MYVRIREKVFLKTNYIRHTSPNLHSFTTLHWIGAKISLQFKQRLHAVKIESKYLSYK